MFCQLGNRFKKNHKPIVEAQLAVRMWMVSLLTMLKRPSRFNFSPVDLD